MPDLYCPDCGKEKYEKSLTMRAKDDKAYDVEGDCECGSQMKLTNPKKGFPSLGRMNKLGSSY